MCTVRGVVEYSPAALHNYCAMRALSLLYIYYTMYNLYCCLDTITCYVIACNKGKPHPFIT